MAGTAGSILKKAREKKGLSIEEVSERTRIHRQIIIDIEQDRILQTATPFYARGFVRSYARFLGAENDEVIKQFLAQTEKQKKEPRLTVKPEKNPLFPELIKKYRAPLKAIGISVAALLTLFIAIALLKEAAAFIHFRYSKYTEARREAVLRKKEKAPKGVEKKKTSPAAEGIKAAAASPEKAGKGSTPIREKETDHLLLLEIEATANTWLKIKSDGELVFIGIFKKGSRDTWRAKKEIELEAGNAGAIKITLNGKDLGTPGKKGEKKTITLTPEGVR